MPRRHIRKARDAYNTPLPLACCITTSLWRHVPAPRMVIEPSAGTGNFVLAARAVWPRSRIVACDVRPGRLLAEFGADEVHTGDWVKVSYQLARRRGAGRHIIIGNPPFRQAQAHVEAGLALLRRGEHLAFLLRAGFQGSLERVPFWLKNHARLVRSIVPRPSFAFGGTDSQEYSLFVWEKGYRGRAELLDPLVWRSA